jgi:hypothetical protein
LARVDDDVTLAVVFGTKGKRLDKEQNASTHAFIHQLRQRMVRVWEYAE